MTATAHKKKSVAKPEKNWGKGRFKKMIVQQRKFLWSDDLLSVYAKWMGLKQGITAIDVGCGLGYLGYTYWKYFGKGGKYIGVDLSEELLKDASIGAKEWAKGGKYEFIKGDAYKLPFPDKSADWVMCQTLMMHLKEPKKALREMIRVLKPGGLIMCKEPDNLTGSLGGHYKSWSNLNIDDQLHMSKYHLLGSQGRKNLGRGDDTIGNKIPHMLSELGMKEIDARLNDKVWLMEPPYDSKMQKHVMKGIKENLNDSKERAYWMKIAKEELIAGGGTVDDFERAKKIMNKLRRVGRKHIKENKFASCSSGFFYIIKARKPKRMLKK